MPTKHSRISAMVYPETDSVIEQLMKLTGHHKGAIVREALEAGAKVLLNHYQNLSPTPTTSRIALFYHGRQMYRDRLPMPSERELMLGWRFERDMQVELEQRLSNLEEFNES